MENPFKPTRAKGKAMPTDQFIGAYIPEKVAEHFTLLALFRGIPKSALLEQAIRVSADAMPVKEIMQFLIKRVAATWKAELLANDGKDTWKTAAEKDTQLQYFKQEWSNYLKKTVSLSNDKITEILDGM